VVTSDGPKVTPIFWRTWLIKMRVVLLFDTTLVSLRIDFDIIRACRPICMSPIWPSSSSLGASAATESTTIMSRQFERTSISTMSSPCSPLSGWETSRDSRCTPSARA